MRKERWRMRRNPVQLELDGRNEVYLGSLIQASRCRSPSEGGVGWTSRRSGVERVEGSSAVMSSVYDRWRAGRKCETAGVKERGCKE